MFANESPGTDPERRLLCVTPLAPGYGVETVFTAFGVLAADRPDVHLDLVGEGPLLDALRTQARTLSLEDRIHFRGPEVTDAEFGFSVLVLPREIDRSPGSPQGPDVMLDVLSGTWPASGHDQPDRWRAVLQAAPTLLVSSDDAVGLAVALVAVLGGPSGAAPQCRTSRRNGLSGRVTPPPSARWHRARRATVH